MSPSSSSVQNRHVTGVQRALGAGLATVCGVAMAVQSRINGQLGAHLHDGIDAAVLSFTGGLLLLLVFVPTTSAGRRGLAKVRAALREGRLRWWQCVGGACGAFLVTTQGLTVTALGVAVFTIAVVAGQVASSLIVDRAGLGPAGPQPLTFSRVAGALLAVAAVLVAVSSSFSRPSELWPALLPALAGVGSSWQQAVNGRVLGAAGNAFVAALVNFLVGTVALVAVAVVNLAVGGRPAGPRPPGGGARPAGAPHTWWLYIGGTLGIVAIAAAAIGVWYVGVLLVGLCSIAGQLVGAVLLDLLVPAAGHPLVGSTVFGIVLMLLAVAVVALPGWRR